MGIIEKFRTKPRPAPPPLLRVPRSTVWFTKIHDPQLNTVLGLGPLACMLYLILAREGRRHRGRPFVLPTDALVTMKGLSRTNLWRTLLRLEKHGLISTARRASKPPVVAVL